MQSLQPDPKAQYRNVYQGLTKIVRTEGFWRPLRGINATMMGAGPAHALYFACYEKMKRTLSDVFHDGENSHLANGILTLLLPCTAPGPLTQVLFFPYGLIHSGKVEV